MGMIKEFKDFAMRGNVLDMAVGIIIGAAFGAVVKSLVDNLITPPIGLLLGGVDFSALSVVLKPAVGDKPAVLLGYGIFIQRVVDFLIVAFAIFLLIKGVNSLRRRQEEAPAPPPEPGAEEKLLTEIRDLLKTRS